VRIIDSAAAIVAAVAANFAALEIRACILVKKLFLRLPFYGSLQLNGTIRPVHSIENLPYLFIHGRPPLSICAGTRGRPFARLELWGGPGRYLSAAAERLRGRASAICCGDAIRNFLASDRAKREPVVKCKGEVAAGDE
jgi:hypothetical protein